MNKKKVKSPIAESVATQIKKTRNVKKDTLETIQHVLHLYERTMRQYYLLKTACHAAVEDEGFDTDDEPSVNYSPLKLYVLTTNSIMELTASVENIRSKVWKESFLALINQLQVQLNELISTVVEDDEIANEQENGS